MSAGMIILAVVAGVLAVLVYFLPSIIAIRRNHHLQASIIVVNLFLGWSLIAWVVALAMSVSGMQSQKMKLIFISGGALFVSLAAFSVAFLAWPLVHFYFHSQYQVALEEVRKNPKVTERLGEPIETVRPFPAGNPGNDTLGLVFSIRGPKGEADVQTQSRLFDGKWEFQLFDVNFNDGSKVDIASEIFKRGGNDTPKFDPHAKIPDDVKVPDLPPDIVLPMLPETPE